MGDNIKKSHIYLFQLLLQKIKKKLDINAYVLQNTYDLQNTEEKKRHIMLVDELYEIENIYRINILNMQMVYIEPILKSVDKMCGETFLHLHRSDIPNGRNLTWNYLKHVINNVNNYGGEIGIVNLRSKYVKNYTNYIGIIGTHYSLCAFLYTYKYHAEFISPILPLFHGIVGDLERDNMLCYIQKGQSGGYRLHTTVFYTKYYDKYLLFHSTKKGSQILQLLSVVESKYEIIQIL